MLRGLTLPADEVFLRYRGGQILVERLDGPISSASTRGELIVKNRRGEVVRKPKGWEQLPRPGGGGPNFQSFDFNSNGKVVGSALLHGSEKPPEVRDPTAGALHFEDADAPLLTTRLWCWAIAVMPDGDVWCDGWDVDAKRKMRGWLLYRVSQTGSIEPFLPQPLKRLDLPKRGLPDEDSASAARRSIGVWRGPDGAIWAYARERGQLARFRPTSDARYYDLRRGEATPYLNVAVHPANRVIAIPPVRAGHYQEEGLATRANGFYELDQGTGAWHRIEGMPEMGGRWRLVAAEGNEVVIHDPRAGRLEWSTLPDKR